MPRWGMVVDLAKCSGCQACVVACQSENNMACVAPDEAQRGRIMAWMRVLPEIEGEYPRVKMRSIPVSCQHCDSPPCIKVCPVKATGMGSDGIVRQVFARCIGCRYCTTACPYTTRVFNFRWPQFTGDFAEALNPDVSIRPKGVVEKCTLCHHRLMKTRENARAAGRALAEGEYVPACAEICPADAIAFGDLDNPESNVAQLARSTRAYRLQEDLGTHPKVIFLTEGEWGGARRESEV